MFCWKMLHSKTARVEPLVKTSSTVTALYHLAPVINSYAYAEQFFIFCQYRTCWLGILFVVSAKPCLGLRTESPIAKGRP